MLTSQPDDAGAARICEAGRRAGSKPAGERSRRELVDPDLAATRDLADRGQLPGRLIGRATALGSLITLGVAISFLARFDTGASGLQFVTDKVWIGALGIHYKLGIDGLNIALIVLTTVLFSGSLIWSAGREWDRPRLFYLHFGLAQTARARRVLRAGPGLVRRVLRPDAIPFYFLTGMWGTGPDRVRATTKLVIYTLVGSFLMLVAAIATAVLASSDHGTRSRSCCPRSSTCRCRRPRRSGSSCACRRSESAWRIRAT